MNENSVLFSVSRNSAHNSRICRVHMHAPKSTPFSFIRSIFFRNMHRTDCRPAAWKLNRYVGTIIFPI